MDSTQPGFWISIGLGGSVVAAMSAFSQWRSKEASHSFRPQPVIRDFCFGAFLTAILYMFLPESFETLLSKGTSVAAGAVEKATRQLGGGSHPASSSISDLELQTGPARF
jgi:hypothetical protein